MRKKLGNSVGLDYMISGGVDQHNTPCGALKGSYVRAEPLASNFRDELERELRCPSAPVRPLAAGSQGLVVRYGVWCYSIQLHLRVQVRVWWGREHGR